MARLGMTRAAGVSAMAIMLALLIVCISIQQYAERVQSASMSAPLGSSELLTIQSLMHVPACAADKHCRSACRLVCDEVRMGSGSRDYASSLISFGCCSSSPVITKQVTSARETQLHMITNDHAVDRLPVQFLRNGHSLKENFDILKREESAVAKRLAKLKLKDVLPFRVKQGGQLAFQPQPPQPDGTKRNSTKTDPYGVERQAERKGNLDAKWQGFHCIGKDCPEENDSFQTWSAYEAYLAATNQFGLPVSFHNESSVKYVESDPSELERLLRETEISGFGEPYEEDEMPDFADDVENLYQEYRWCVFKSKDKLDDCLKKLREQHLQWEWHRIPGCIPNVTVNASFHPENKSFIANANASCLQLVPMRTFRTYGYDVATGKYPMENLTNDLEDFPPSEEAIRHLLGDDLYAKYEEEEKNSLTLGEAHQQFNLRRAEIRRRQVFQKAFNKTEFEWCLHQHKHDEDFPRACTGDGRMFIKKPYQGTEAAGQKHTNKFEYGPTVVQPGHVAAEPAPWLRMKLIRDQPQTVEGKMALVRDRSRLPGVNVDSWGGAMPSLYHSRRDPVAYTPNQCCSHFVDMSEWA
eukprot:766662-Hanusia_phi.AAC.5